MLSLEQLYRRYGRMRVGLWITLVSFAVSCFSILFVLTELVFRPQLNRLAPDSGAMEWLFPWMATFTGVCIVWAGLLIHFGLILPVLRRRKALEADLSRAAPREQVEILASQREKLDTQLSAALDDNLALRDQLAERSTAQEQLCRALLEPVDDALLLIDRRGKVQAASGGAAERLKMPCVDLPGQSAQGLIKAAFEESQVDDWLMHELTRLAGPPGRVVAGPAVASNAMGEALRLQLWSLTDGNAPLSCLRLPGEDAGRSRQLAAFDLSEPRLRASSANQGLRQNLQGVSDAGLALLQIDNLPVIVDQLGMAAGETLISQLGDMISKHLPEGAQVLRPGAVHWLVILPDLSEDQLLDWAETLRVSVDGHDFAYEERSYRASLSIAVTSYSETEGRMPGLLAQLDQQLCLARRLGGNRIQQPAPDELVETTREVERQLLDWLDDAGSSAPLQLQSRVLEGGDQSLVYAMLRVELHDGFWIDPVAFVSSAGQHGLMGRIDAWLVERALNAFKNTQGVQERYARVIVPISAGSVADEQFATELILRMDEHQLPAERLCVAIEESVCRRRTAAVLRLLQSLRPLGVTFALSACRANGIADLGPRLKPELALLHPSQFADPDDALVALELDYLLALGRKLSLQLGVADPLEANQREFLRRAGVDLLAMPEEGVGPIY